VLWHITPFYDRETVNDGKYYNAERKNLQQELGGGSSAPTQQPAERDDDCREDSSDIKIAATYIREECKLARHLWSSCLSLCKLRACSQTKTETHPRGTSPSRAGKRAKRKMGMKSRTGKTESKRGEAASLLPPNPGSRPEKGRGRPSSFLL
jgi:hypothetical protein